MNLEETSSFTHLHSGWDLNLRTEKNCEDTYQSVKLCDTDFIGVHHTKLSPRDQVQAKLSETQSHREYKYTEAAKYIQITQYMDCNWVLIKMLLYSCTEHQQQSEQTHKHSKHSCHITRQSPKYIWQLLCGADERKKSSLFSPLLCLLSSLSSFLSSII